jgi:hypothetical protein
LAVDKGKEPIMEHFHTPSSFENMLSWGYQPIPKAIDEVTDVESVAYDYKRQFIVKRTQEK